MNNEGIKHNVHHILAHSYVFYFGAFLVGLVLDFIFPIKILEKNITIYSGIIFLFLATFLIFWAQKTSRNLDKNNLKKETFCKGPYRYTRTPTSWGLFFLILGFGIMVNAFFIILFTVISFIVTKFVFLRKQEEILAQKYGEPYLEYKRSVKF